MSDTVTTGSGIYVSANFDAHPFAGLVEITSNTLLRCGAHESDMGGPTGAFRLLASDRDMTGASFLFHDNTVLAPLESAVSLQGPHRLTGVKFEGLTIEAAALVVDVRPGARGAAEFRRVTGSGVFRNPDPNGFALTH